MVSSRHYCCVPCKHALHVLACNIWRPNTAVNYLRTLPSHSYGRLKLQNYIHLFVNKTPVLWETGLWSMEGPREIFVLHITNQICFMKTYSIYLVIFLTKATSPFIISVCFFRRTYSVVNLNRTYFVLLPYNSYVKNSSLDG